MIEQPVATAALRAKPLPPLAKFRGRDWVFETGMTELGGHAVCLRPGEMHLPGRESIGDTARVLSRFLHAEARTHTAASLRELAECASIAVINGEAGDFDPPIQSVTYALTILEYGGSSVDRSHYAPQP